MKTYEIEDYSGLNPIVLMEDGKIINADTGRKALAAYLKSIEFKGKVKVSSSNEVQFKVTPIVIENGRKYIDRRNGQRSLWYQILKN